MPMNCRLLILLSLLLVGCLQSHPSTIGLVDAQSPTIKVGGKQKLQWVWFQGPYQHDQRPAVPDSGNGDDPKKIIIWRIAPPDFKEIPMDSAPQIIYGVLPEGWEQEIPKERIAPPPF
jgi:hypothetical protein